MMTEENPAATAAQFWDEFYGDSERVWSGKPNPLLVREVSDLEPGTALDLGCGEGADAIWLAGRGWRVTAVDVSAAALERAAAHAAQAGVTGAIDWRRHDLAESFPAGSFDLVGAHFLHSPLELPWERIMRSAAAAVAPGGVLLVAGHGEWPSWEEGHRDHEVHFPTLDEMLDSFALAEGEWRVEVKEAVLRELTGPRGQRGTRTDNIVRVRRAKD